MSDFLPDDFDGIPQGDTKYLKFQEGENSFRILSKAIIGYEYWIDEDKQRKPVRVKDIEDIPDEFLNNKDNRKKAKYFWAFVIYNPTVKNIQILEIKQKKIMNGIMALDNSKAWGDPKAYNIVVTKTKTGPEDRDVEYSVMPEPKEKLENGIEQLYKDMEIDLEQLFSGGDPFKADKEKFIDEVSEKIK